MANFATRLDLLARTNARTLQQLAVPADFDMPQNAEALREVIQAESETAALTEYTKADQDTLILALEAIDQALTDATDFMITYGLPAAAQSNVLARMCSIIAFYYLYSAETLPEAISEQYKAQVKMLESHTRGMINLIPADPNAPPSDEGTSGITMTSAPSRYIGSHNDEESDWA